MYFDDSTKNPRAAHETEATSREQPSSALRDVTRGGRSHRRSELDIKLIDARGTKRAAEIRAMRRLTWHDALLH